MSSSSKLEQVKQWFDNCMDSDRVAHALLLAGPRESTRQFARYILRRLLCTGGGSGDDGCSACRQVDRDEHPDIFRISPESKSRIIRIHQIRDLNKRIWETSFYGGWKAAVIEDADRLNPESANSFLKTLEEPPENSILLLLSEHPDELLPTIRSRCQHFNLFGGTAPAEGEWVEDLLTVLRQGSPSNPLHVIRMSSEIQAILEKERDRLQAEMDSSESSQTESKEQREAGFTAKVLKLRQALLKQMILWNRDLLMVVLGTEESRLHFPEEIDSLREQAAGLSYSAATRILAETETMARRMKRQVPDGLILEDSLMTQAAIAYKSKLAQPPPERTSAD